MTARDEAIEVVLASGLSVHKSVIAGVVDTLTSHSDVLVQLAIDQGALERVGYADLNMEAPRIYRGSVPLAPDHWLYRVVEP